MISLGMLSTQEIHCHHQSIYGWHAPKLLVKKQLKTSPMQLMDLSLAIKCPMALYSRTSEEGTLWGQSVCQRSLSGRFLKLPIIYVVCRF